MEALSMDRVRMAVCAGVFIVAGILLVVFRSHEAPETDAPEGQSNASVTRVAEGDADTGTQGQSRLVGSDSTGSPLDSAAAAAEVRPQTDGKNLSGTRLPPQQPVARVPNAVRDTIAAYSLATGLSKIETARAEGTFEHTKPDGTTMKARLVVIWQKPDKMLELLLDENGNVINRQLFLGIVTQSENTQEGVNRMSIRDELNPGNDLLGLSLPVFATIMEAAQPVLVTRNELERMFPEEDKEKLVERQCIEMTSKKDGPYVRLLFDEKSSSMVGMEVFHSEGDEPVVRAGVVSYKEFEPGIRLPNKVVIHNDFEGVFRVTFDKVSTNIEIPEDTFRAKSMPLSDVADWDLEDVKP
jgi:hypothetical protein